MTTEVAYVCADPGIAVFGTKGASVHVQEIVRAWRRRGAGVQVWARRRGEHAPVDLARLPVHELPARAPAADPAARERQLAVTARMLADQVSATRPDVVYERFSLFSTVLHRVRRRHPAVVRILEVNAPLLDEQRRHRTLVDEAGAREALRLQVAAADVVACVSDPVADWVRGHCPQQGAEIVVVPNGVDTERFQPVEPDLHPAPVVVFVGTLKPWHGVEYLIEAAARAERPWRVRIIGDGPQREALRRLARQRGVLVDFTGAVAPVDVPAALSGALIATAPYPDGDNYFSPLKVFEYGAAGLPVVASRVGQVPALVEHGHTGLLVPPGDPGALAAAVDRLAADPGLARRMGAAGRDRMVARHSWDRVLQDTLAPVLVRS